MATSLLSAKDDHRYFTRQLLRYIFNEKNKFAKFILDTKNLKNAIVNDTGITLLHFSARSGNIEITNYLIKLRVNLDAQDEHGNTALVCVLLDNCDNDFEAPVDTDRSQERLDIIKILLKGNPNLYLVNNEGWNALQIALKVNMYRLNSPDIRVAFIETLKIVCDNNYMLIARILVENDCSLERVVLLNDSDLTRSMISCGSPLTARDPKTGSTALHTAVSIMSTENVKVLIEHGLDIYAADRQGYIPIRNYYDDACFFEFGVHPREDPEILKILIDHMESVNEQWRGQFIVEEIARIGDEQAIQTLFQYDIDFHEKDIDGKTLLHYFAENRCRIIATLLKDKNFDPNVRDRNGWNALAYAVNEPISNYGVIKVLLEKGADPDPYVVYWDSDPSPLISVVARWVYYSVYMDDLKIMAVLLQYGANLQWDYRQTVFECFQEYKRFYNDAKIPLAHLAIDAALGKPITERIRNQVSANPMFQNHFEMCKRKLNRMKKISIYRSSLSMFKLLTEKEETIIRRYAFNQEFPEKLETINRKSYSNFYYHGLVRKRLAKIISKITLIQKAAQVICKLIRLRRRVDDIIIREIISYLDDTELQNLNKLVCD